MPLTSAHPPLDIPNVDLWTLLFGRRELGFSNQKGNTLVIELEHTIYILTLES